MAKLGLSPLATCLTASLRVETSKSNCDQYYYRYCYCDSYFLFSTIHTTAVTIIKIIMYYCCLLVCASTPSVMGFCSRYCGLS